MPRRISDGSSFLTDVMSIVCRGQPVVVGEYYLGVGCWSMVWRLAHNESIDLPQWRFRSSKLDLERFRILVKMSPGTIT